MHHIVFAFVTIIRDEDQGYISNITRVFVSLLAVFRHLPHLAYPWL